jgi:cell division transport system permease protein
VIAWMVRHVQTAIGALGRLGGQPVATLMTTLVIGIALALPTCLYLCIENARSAGSSWDRGIDLSVYLKTGVSEASARAVFERVRQRRDVGDVQLITAAEALQSFGRDSGFGPALDALQENPLPHTLVVTPRAQDLERSHLDSLANDLRSLPEVELVQLDTAWVERLRAILDAVRRGVLLTGGLLAVGVILIVSNTIRLDIFGRRAEIEVTKLVGGSDGFVRRPFLYTGVWYGLCGGFLAALITFGALAVLTEPVAKIAALYGTEFRLRGLGIEGLAALALTGICLGWFGSFLSTSRHLRDIEPS